MSAKKRFEFGENWQEFIDKSFSQERVDISRKYLLEFVGFKTLKGVKFLDIGCGSGLHSLAAWQAGTDQILSFDYDINSVRTTQQLKDQKAGSPDNWKVEQGSVLDSEYMSSIGRFDLVYSWGVLHHTGDLWSAIKHAASVVGDKGFFYIALYSADVFKDPPPEYWVEIKKKYINSSKTQQYFMILWYIWKFHMKYNPIRLPSIILQAVKYKHSRGMNYITDIKDWLGGWPIEFSHDEDVIKVLDEDLGFDLVKIKQGEANTEYLFRKR